MAFDDGATSTKAPDREILDWPTFGEATRQITQTIVDSGWIPDLIVAIARGGLLPAGAISYAMGIKSIGTMNVEFYTDVHETLPEPVLLPPLMDVSTLEGKKVLVVDDVADSGKTLKMVMELIAEKGLSLDGTTLAHVDAKCAVIYEKPQSVIKPDFSWKITDKWINFPWSSLPVVTPSN